MTQNTDQPQTTSASPTAQILVLNAGSSSLKLGLFDWASQTQQTAKAVDWGKENDSKIQNHAEALTQLLEDVTLEKVVAVGHRVVQGGPDYHAAVRIDPKVKQVIKDLIPLAPLHNAVALEVIEAVEQKLPKTPQVAAFDTSFHASLEPKAYIYPVPYEWYEKWGVRRFGFHGLSHAYCVQRAAEMLERDITSLKLVNCHLGSGCSLAAIKGGKSVATTMGFTPLEGLMMGTRSGSVDPGILLYLLENNYLDSKALDQALNHASGLKGVSGLSADMREIETARQKGHARAQLAWDIYVERIIEGVGAMTAALGGTDVLVFAAGVGEHSVPVRSAVLESLAWLGLELDEAANRADQSQDHIITTKNSRVQALVIHTHEELMVARETHGVLAPHLA